MYPPKSPDELGSCTFTVRGSQLKIQDKVRDYLEHWGEASGHVGQCYPVTISREVFLGWGTQD